MGTIRGSSESVLNCSDSGKQIGNQSGFRKRYYVVKYQIFHCRLDFTMVAHGKSFWS